MRVKCIDENDCDGITELRIYDVLEKVNSCFCIINDLGEEEYYFKYRFKPIIEEATPSSLADQVRALELENQELKLKLEQIKKLLE